MKTLSKDAYIKLLFKNAASCANCGSSNQIITDTLLSGEASIICECGKMIHTVANLDPRTLLTQLFDKWNLQNYKPITLKLMEKSNGETENPDGISSD